MSSSVTRASHPVKHPFLSDAWFDAMDALRPLLPDVPEQLGDALVNVAVTGGQRGPVGFHIAGGAPVRGLHPGAPTTIELPYGTARSMLVDGDPKGAMLAFLSGRLVVKGDLTPLLGLQALAPDLDDLTAEHGSLIAQIQAITAEDPA